MKLCNTAEYFYDSVFIFSILYIFSKNKVFESVFSSARAEECNNVSYLNSF